MRTSPWSNGTLVMIRFILILCAALAAWSECFSRMVCAASIHSGDRNWGTSSPSALLGVGAGTIALAAEPGEVQVGHLADADRRRRRQLVAAGRAEVGPKHRLLGSRAPMDAGDRCGRGEAAGDEPRRDARDAGRAHEDHDG